MEGKSSVLFAFISKMAEWFSRFASVNFLWFHMNIPIFFILFSMIVHQNYLANFILLFLLIPTLFIPSTIAMIAVLRDWVLKNKGDSIMKGFGRYLKENYKMGVKIGLIQAAIWTIWGIDFQYFYKIHDLFGVLFIVIALFLIAWSFHCMAYVAHYQMSMKDILKNSFIFTAAHPLALLFVVVIVGSIVYATYKFLIILPFFTGSIIAYFSFLVFHIQIQKIEES